MYISRYLTLFWLSAILTILNRRCIFIFFDYHKPTLHCTLFLNIPKPQLNSTVFFKVIKIECEAKRKKQFVQQHSPSKLLFKNFKFLRVALKNNHQFHLAKYTTPLLGMPHWWQQLSLQYCLDNKQHSCSSCHKIKKINKWKM